MTAENRVELLFVDQVVNAPLAGPAIAHRFLELPEAMWSRGRFGMVGLPDGSADVLWRRRGTIPERLQCRNDELDCL